MLQKIISGGQTGVDRAALDVALELGIACGGWCPKGRKAEDGRIDDRYPLTETPTRKYRERTEWNVRDSDGTLIFASGELTGGTRLTLQFAEDLRKPVFRVDLNDPPEAEDLRGWLVGREIRILNIAGPRSSTDSGVYERTRQLLSELLPPLASRDPSG